VRPGSVLYIPFDSYAGSTGASAATTGLAVGDVKIFKNGSVTERSSTSGFTLLDTDGLDFDSITGLNGFSIDLSDNADAGFYVAGARYWVVISSVTIDGQTVNFTAATFNIGYVGAILDTTIASLSSQTSFTLTAGPAEANALIGSTVIVHDIASGVQIAQGVISAYAVTTKTVTLAFDPGIFTMAAGDNISVFPRTNVYAMNGQASLTELTGVPGATPTVAQALMLMYMALRNKQTTTATETKIHNDAGTAIATGTLSDDGTTFQKTEFS
jgi:hypothetical protein